MGLAHCITILDAPVLKKYVAAYIKDNLMNLTV